VLLSAYWLVPVAALLLVAVTSEKPPFTRDREDSATRSWTVSLRASRRSSTSARGLASTGSYYGAITLTLLVPGDRRLRADARASSPGAIAVAAILIVMGAEPHADVLYWPSTAAIPRREGPERRPRSTA
jgi:hypothetical protein